MALSFYPAWRLKNPELERQALAFWEGNGVLGSADRRQSRLAQLCTLAYGDGALVGVATIALRHIETLNCRMAMLRVAIDREHRRQRAATEIAVETITFMERWSLENPEEDVRGVGAIIQSAGLVAHERNTVWPHTKLTFAGYTAQGEQFRLRWFKDALTPEPPPPDKRMPLKLTARQM